MIETKEQYEEAYSKTNSTVRECLETIEALRRFVRAHDVIEAGTTDRDQRTADVLELLNSRKALPDWITE